MTDISTFTQAHHTIGGDIYIPSGTWCGLVVLQLPDGLILQHKVVEPYQHIPLSMVSGLPVKLKFLEGKLYLHEDLIISSSQNKAIVKMFAVDMLYLEYSTDQKDFIFDNLNQCVYLGIVVYDHTIHWTSTKRQVFPNGITRIFPKFNLDLNTPMNTKEYINLGRMLISNII